MIVAIDGPSGAGKSTLAKLLAGYYGLTAIDTGAMYRAVGLAALEAGIPLDDDAALSRLISTITITFVEADGQNRLHLNGQDVSERLRTQEVAEAASAVSTRGLVREKLVALQRHIAQGASVVMEGRDIGSVVFPNADVKFFLDASEPARAGRRLRDLNAAGTEASLSEVLKAHRERDRRDQGREHSPLRRLPEAVYIDTTGSTPDEVFGTMQAAIERACPEEAARLRQARLSRGWNPHIPSAETGGLAPRGF